jgi:hypothetical protein
VNWKEGKSGDWLDSEDGSYRIVLVPGGGAMLIAFDEEDADGEVWRKLFPTVEAAKEAVRP